MRAEIKASDPTAVFTSAISNESVGFPASRVDLGWLQEALHAYYRTHQPSPSRLDNQSRSEIVEVVQRVKECKLTLDSWPIIEIHLETKDDWSSYFYVFRIHLEQPFFS